MSFVAVGAGIAAAGSIYSIGSGISQIRRARRLRESAVDPGYEVNQALIDNARIMQERYGNYTLPGYESMRANVNQAGAQAFDRGVQGASSSADVLELASRIAYGQQQGMNEIEMLNAAGRDQALMQSLDANVAAGQEYQRRNQYEIDQYRQQLAEAGALQQAGAMNTAQGVGGLATIGSSLAMNEAARRQGIAGQQNIDVNNQGSIFGGGQQTQNIPASPFASNLLSDPGSNPLDNDYRRRLREALVGTQLTPLIRRDG